jgi:two-component system response regulator YesN
MGGEIPTLLKHRKGKKVAIILLLTYLIILSIPTIIGSLVYYYSYSFASKSVRQSNYYLLEQCISIIDANIEEINSTIVRISQDTMVNSLLHLNEQPSRQDMSLYYTVKNLKQHTLSSSDIIRGIYVFYKDSGIIISPDYAYSRNNFFYDHTFAYKDMSESSWFDYLFSEYHNRNFLPAAETYFSGKTYSTVCCLQSIPLQFPNKCGGTIAVFINTDSLKRLLEPLVADGGYALIMDDKKNLLFSEGTDDIGLDLINIMDELPDKKGYSKSRVAGTQMNISYATSALNNWTFVVAVPNDVIMAELSNILKTTLIIILITLALCMLISYYFAHNNTKPLKDMINSLTSFLSRDLHPTENEYEFINLNILKLIEKNESLASRIQEQSPLLKAAFFDCALRGGFVDENEFRSYMAYSGINLNGEKYAVIIMKLCDYNNTETIHNENKSIVCNVLSGMQEPDFCYYDMGKDAILIIIGLRHTKQWTHWEHLKEYSDNLYKILHIKYNLDVLMAVGNPYDRLTDINKSYEEAKKAIACWSASSRPIIFYEEIEEGKDNYYFPLELEAKLMSAVKSGDMEGIRNILDKLYSENYIIRKLSPVSLIHLLNEIRGTFYKLYIQLPENNTDSSSPLFEDIRNNAGLDDPEMIYRYLFRGFEGLCEIFHSQLKSHNIDLKSSIIKYIDMNYIDPDLCVSSISSKFGLSESYFSQFFKEQTGENFSAYLENRRIKHACDLLDTTEKSVNEITGCVGYNNSDTFRKAFRRVTGLSPTRYKNSKINIYI